MSLKSQIQNPWLIKSLPEDLCSGFIHPERIHWHQLGLNLGSRGEHVIPRPTRKEESKIKIFFHTFRVCYNYRIQNSAKQCTFDITVPWISKFLPNRRYPKQDCNISLSATNLLVHEDYFLWELHFIRFGFFFI